MSADLNKIITMDECKLVCEKKLGTKQFDLNKYFVEQNGETRTGYTAHHLRLNCEVVHNNQTKTLTFFIKQRIHDTSDYVVAILSENHDIFNNEQTILKLLTNHSVPASYVAQFYLYNKEKQFIVMENLKERGFQLAKIGPFQPLDLQHCQVGLKTIAKFHTFSFKYQHDKRKTTPDYSLIDEFPKLFEEVLLHLNNDFSRKWMQASKVVLINLVDYLEPEQKMSKQQLKELMDKKFDLLIEHSKSYKDQYNVISHGDLWGNNLMFRYSEDNENEPVDCCLIDFQVLRFLPPAEDVLLFLYLNTYKEFRDQYFEELVDFYYKSLTEELKSVGLDSNVVYPLKQFREHLKDRVLHVLFVACIYKAFWVLSADRIKELMSDKDTTDDFQLGNRWKYIEEGLRKNNDARIIFMPEFQLLIDEIVANYT